MNPRTGITRLLVFEASPFSLLGTSPYFNHSFIMLAQAKPFCKEFLILNNETTKVGETAETF